MSRPPLDPFDRESVTSADLVRDEIDSGAIKWGIEKGFLATGIAEGNLPVVRKMFVSQTPEGRRLHACYSAAQGHISLEAAGEEWLGVANLTEKTKREYRRFLKRAQEALPPINDITRDDARKFIQAEAAKFSRKSITNQQSALSGLWSHLGREPSLWTAFRVDAAVPAVRRLVWQPDDLKMLFSSAKSVRLRQAMFLALHTGARAAEIAGLRYDEASDTVSISRDVTKTDAGVRVLPCPEAIRVPLKAWVARPWSAQTISNRFSQHKTALKFGEEKVFHSFRHTLITRLHSQGVQEATVSLIAGHVPKGFTYRTYGSGVDPETFRPILNGLHWESVIGPVSWV